MNVPSAEFFAFAALVALAINLRPSAGWRGGVLLLANVAFFATFASQAAQLVPFAALIVAGFAATTLMARTTSRAAFAATVCAFVLAFVWLKRYTFVPASLLLPFPYAAVGMSYVFFRMLSLVIDAFQRVLPAPVGPVSYANYTLNFTSLVSGPIQLYGDYVRDEREPAPFGRADAARAVERIIAGSFKVCVLSPLLAFAHQHLLAATAAAALPAGAGFAALAVAVFPVYLYANFSGYMDVVIGVARFLRIRLPENFRHPFGAEGFIEFWSRWHITLSSWLKTYVFSPLLLAAMRRYPSRAVEPYLGVFAFFVTFFLVGLWHGQTSEFVFYGLLQGLGVSANKLYQIVMTRRLGRKGYRALCASPLYAALSRGLTIAYFAGTLLWFWSTWPQLRHAGSALGAGGTVLAALLLFALVTVTLAALHALAPLLGGETSPARRVLSSAYGRTAWSTALLTVTVSVTVLLNAPAPHVVYRAF